MNRYKELEKKRYVIADFSTPTNYLLCEGNKHYTLTDNICICTKFATRDVAEMICSDCTNEDYPLVVVPIMITYEILEEE